ATIAETITTSSALCSRSRTNAVVDLDLRGRQPLQVQQATIAETITTSSALCSRSRTNAVVDLDLRGRQPL
ncbi:hypothetical protein C7E12_23205, partial [Stenotrophomonas maltophilia]